MAYKDMLEYWAKNNIDPVQQIVVCAACYLERDDLILAGARHWDAVMRRQFKGVFGSAKPCSDWQQGFIDQFGTFLTREEAMIIVKASGQPFNQERNGCKTRLFSEGIC